MVCLYNQLIKITVGVTAQKHPMLNQLLLLPPQRRLRFCIGLFVDRLAVLSVSRINQKLTDEFSLNFCKKEIEAGEQLTELWRVCLLYTSDAADE